MNARALAAIAASAALLAASGCAVVQRQMAADSGQILAEAGFEKRSLNEPGLPPRQLVERAGSYRFADPDYCRCMYVGGAQEYAALQRLRAERIAEHEWIRSRTIASLSIDPRLWGPWKPQGLDLENAPVAAGTAAQGR